MKKFLAIFLAVALASAPISTAASGSTMESSKKWVVSGFSSKTKTALTVAQKVRITNILDSAPTVTKVSCQGLVPKKASTSQRTLALTKAFNACQFAKSQKVGLVTQTSVVTTSTKSQEGQVSLTVTWSRVSYTPTPIPTPTQSPSKQFFPAVQTSTVTGDWDLISYSFEGPINWGGVEVSSEPLKRFVFRYKAKADIAQIRVTIQNTDGVQFLWGGGGGTDALYVKSGQEGEISFDVSARDIQANRSRGYTGGYTMWIWAGGGPLQLPVTVQLPW